LNPFVHTLRVWIETVSNEDELRHQARCRHPEYNPLRFPIVEYWDPEGRKSKKDKKQKRRKKKHCPDMQYTPMQRRTKLKQRNWRHPLFLGDPQPDKKQKTSKFEETEVREPDDEDEDDDEKI
jgi:hypothetical protein